MGEEASDGELGRLVVSGDDGSAGSAGGEGDEEGRVLEWEIGLPSVDDLTPLSQHLIPPELASAFSISPEPLRTLLDVNRASQNTFSQLRGLVPSSSSAAALRSFHPFPSPAPNTPVAADDPMVVEGGGGGEDDDFSTAKDAAGEFSHKTRRPMEDSDFAATGAENSADDPSARTLKRPRLVWTPQLHKRFVDVVTHLGIKNAVPKTIMQLMNVEGLTRENVASHLQKYRLYLKRMQGLSNEGLSSSDHLFASTPVPQNLHEQPVPVPMPYAMPPMIPTPVYGTPHPHGRGMGMVPVSNHQGNGMCHGFESHHPYGGNKLGSIVSYPQTASNYKQ